VDGLLWQNWLIRQWEYSVALSFYWAGTKRSQWGVWTSWGSSRSASVLLIGRIANNQSVEKQIVLLFNFSFLLIQITSAWEIMVKLRTQHKRIWVLYIRNKDFNHVNLAHQSIMVARTYILVLRVHKIQDTTLWWLHLLFFIVIL